MTNEVRELFELASGTSSGYSYGYGGSRAASTQEPKDDVKVTEIINRLIVSRPAKKIIDIGQSTTAKEESESGPEIIELGGNSKAASSQAVNEVKELFNLHFG